MNNVGSVPTELVTISALVGMVLPGLIAVLNRYHWPTEAKAACAFVVCVVAAGVIAWWDQTLDWSNYRIAILTVLTSALGFYHAIWRPSGVADSLERKTG